MNIGYKYEITFFKEEALQLLDDTFPSSLYHRDYNIHRHIRISGIDQYWEVLTLSRRHGILHVQPSLFLNALLEFPSVEKLMQKPPLAAGADAMGQHFDNCGIALGGLKRMLSIDPIDIWPLEPSAFTFEVSSRGGNYALPFAKCQVGQTSTCAAARQTFFKSVAQKSQGINLFRRVYFEKVEGWAEICTQCQHDATLYYDACRDKLWNSLPSWFGLPEWSHIIDPEDNVPPFLGRFSSRLLYRVLNGGKFSQDDICWSESDSSNKTRRVRMVTFIFRFQWEKQIPELSNIASTSILTTLVPQIPHWPHRVFFLACF